MYTNIKNRLDLCLQRCWNVLMHVMEQKKLQNCKTYVNLTPPREILGNILEFIRYSCKY